MPMIQVNASKLQILESVELKYLFKTDKSRIIAIIIIAV